MLDKKKVVIREKATIAIVIWQDPTSYDDYKEKHEIPKLGLTRTYSVGWLLNEKIKINGKECIQIARSWTEDKSIEGTLTIARDLISDIPMDQILDIKKIVVCGTKRVIKKRSKKKTK